MRPFVERRLGSFIYALVLICAVEIGFFTWHQIQGYKRFNGDDYPSHVVSIFRPFRYKIPHRANFNVYLEKGTNVAVKRLAQFALAPRLLHEGTNEAWLIYYSANKLPLPPEIASSRNLVFSKGPVSLYRQKD